MTESGAVGSVIVSQVSGRSSEHTQR